MNKDFLKQFVDGNRSDFEIEMTDKDLLWQQISAGVETPKRSKFNYWKVATIAASFLVLALFTLLMTPNLGGDSPEAVAQAEFVDIQSFYESQISEHTMTLAAYDPSYLAVVKDFDDQYQQLVTDLETTGNTEVLEKMVDLYRAKLQVLEDLLDEINEKEKRHETSI